MDKPSLLQHVVLLQSIMMSKSKT